MCRRGVPDVRMHFDDDRQFAAVLDEVARAPQRLDLVAFDVEEQHVWRDPALFAKIVDGHDRDNRG